MKLISVYYDTSEPLQKNQQHVELSDHIRANVFTYQPAEISLLSIPPIKETHPIYCHRHIDHIVFQDLTRLLQIVDRQVLDHRQEL